MSEDPTRYAQLERKAKKATRWWVIGAFVAALAFSTMGYAVVSTAQNTSALVAYHKETAQVLLADKALEANTAKLTKEAAKALAAGQLLLVSKLDAAIAELDAAEAQNAAVCAALPGCEKPSG